MASLLIPTQSCMARRWLIATAAQATALAENIAVALYRGTIATIVPSSGSGRSRARSHMRNVKVERDMVCHATQGCYQGNQP